MTDPRHQEYIVQELYRRLAQTQKSTRVVDQCFPEQLAFINDPSKRKVALCSRRAGKSWGIASYLIQEALRVPKCSVLYLALTKDSARKTLVKDVLSPLLDRLDLSESTTFNKTTREYTFSNGSVLYLAGADASTKELEKVLGQKYLLVVIDECASFKQDLNDLIDKLVPAVADYDGTICLIGTPSNYTNNLFYDLTADSSAAEKLGWTIHRWNWKQNPHARDNREKTLQREITADPNFLDSTKYKHHWLGVWAVSDSLRCYKQTSRNLIPEPPLTDPSWFFVLGTDLGLRDATAFAVLAYNYTSPKIYILESEKHSNWDFETVAQHVRHLSTRYRFCKYVIDGANAQGVEHMRRRSNIPWISTKKSPGYKFDAIHLMSSDFTTERILVVESKNQELIKEYQGLTWDPKEPTREHPSAPNHLTDAALYAYLQIHNNNATPLPPQKHPEETPRMSPLAQSNDDQEPLQWLHYNLNDYLK